MRHFGLGFAQPGGFAKRFLGFRSGFAERATAHSSLARRFAKRFLGFRSGFAERAPILRV
jgi:hypothetical protein